MTISAREQQWAAWMRAALSGDERAYHAFLNDVAPHLRALARRRCDMFGADKSLAEDIVQEVLLSVHLKRGSWDPARPIGPWLAAITRNRLIDAMRRRGRRVDIPIEDVAETLAALDGADTERDLGDASRLLDRLKDPQRDIVRSISLEGRDVRETAARLNMTEGAVRVALHRALKTLAALYRSTME
ncbi:RNA polymerase sigma factor (sigma-70 family) [Rhizobium sp. SG_E_25_P2]|uniref:sigma-70 family RNA polymerase sigma factor n=1 Tax=Rhizobium sp. SG_E_25_P2 TaxID=2879942 RepID=UPI002474A55E|nr:sigma-70 family RNA polymerase sigma factor [Rhizobium sp. SG_E_25_P2]MDH6268423.1 RNA polymerase sigma factor (sigma-70 family) [Rhizobium sp. SG_E_25_P2]